MLGTKFGASIMPQIGIDISSTGGWKKTEYFTSDGVTYDTDGKMKRNH